MNELVKALILFDRMNQIKTRNKPGSNGIIKKLERQIRELVSVYVKMTLQGILNRNRNHRVYPYETVTKAVDDFNKIHPNQSTFIGEMEHPIDIIRLEKDHLASCMHLSEFTELPIITGMQYAPDVNNEIKNI